MGPEEADGCAAIYAVGEDLTAVDTASSVTGAAFESYPVKEVGTESGTKGLTAANDCTEILVSDAHVAGDVA